jgi:hypothetical protein
MVTGTGISTDPYMLYNLADLELIGTTGYPLSAYYELVNDIDASATSNPSYNSGQGWKPIGDLVTRFTGDFNGAGHAINELNINTPNNDFVGFISLITNPGKIHDVIFDNINITARDQVGAIGYSDGGNVDTIYNITVSGTVTGRTNVGGVLGQDYVGTHVNNCHSSVVITGNGMYIGGVVGYFSQASSIQNCTFSGTVQSTSTGSYFGGVIGAVSDGCNVSNCTSTGIVNVPNGLYVGGIIGYLGFATITNCYCESNNITGYKYVGGILGQPNGCTVSKCSFQGNIHVYERGGGIFGESASDGTLSECYSMGTITSTGGDYIGGIGGVLYLPVADTFSLMNVTGYNSVGGFAGYSLYIAFTNCYSAGLVSGTSEVGGFIGHTYGNTPTNCFFDNQTSGQTTDPIATGKTTLEMQTESTYTDYDFTTPIWVIDPNKNGGYPYLPIPLNFYGNILNTSSIAGKVTEGSAVLLSVYGGILNTSNISGKVTELLETFTVYGNVSNISNLNPKLVRKSSLKTSISNLSDLTFLLGTVKMINLITDQNVVTGTDTYGTIEGFGANAGGQLSSSTDQAHSGSCSLKTIVHGNQNDGWYTDDLWVVSPSTEYTFDVWFNGPVNEVIGLVIQESSGSQPSENVTLTDAEWDHFQFTFTTDSNTNAVRLATSNPNWDNFTYYSDDISLYQGIPISGIQLETIEANIAFTPFLLSTITSLPILSPASLVLDDFTVRISCHTLLGVCEPLATLNNFNISSTKFRWNNLTDVSTIPDGCSVTYDIFTENIDQQQSQVNLSIPMALGQKASNQMIMQTFIPTQNNLTGFGILAMGIVGDFNSAGTVTANIYELTNGIPTTLLQSFVLPKTIDPNNPSVPYWGSQIKNGQQIGIELPLPFDLSGLNNAISYGLILSTDKIDSDNYYNLGISFGNYYKRGGFKYKLNNQWVNDGGADLWFNTYYPINIYTNKTSPVDLSAISLDSIKFRTHLNTNNLAETPVIDSITIKQEEYF